LTDILILVYCVFLPFTKWVPVAHNWVVDKNNEWPWHEWFWKTLPLWCLMKRLLVRWNVSLLFVYGFFPVCWNVATLFVDCCHTVAIPCFSAVSGHCPVFLQFVLDSRMVFLRFYFLYFLTVFLLSSYCLLTVFLLSSYFFAALDAESEHHVRSPRPMYTYLKPQHTI